MKISKLEEGLIEMDVVVKPGNNETNYLVKGKYVSGILLNQIAFDEVIPIDHDDKDPSFSPKETAASLFAWELRDSTYKSFYHDGRIEVIRKMDGNN